MVSLHLRLSGGYPSRELPGLEICAPGLDQAARNELSEGLHETERGVCGGERDIVE